MKDFFKGFLAFGLASSIQKLLGFLILPIYTHQFNKVEYGILDMVNTIIGVTTIFGLLQLETSLQRYYYEFKGVKRKLLVSTVYALIAVASVVIAILIFCFSETLSRSLFHSPKYESLIKTVSFQLPLSNFSMLGLLLLRYEKQNLKFFLVILSNVVFTLSFVYLFVVHLKWGLPGVFYAQLFAICLSTLYVTWYVRHFFIFRISPIMTIKNLKYALPQLPAGVGSMILGQANRFFMLSYLSLGAIGVYAVSIRLASSIQLANTAFILAWAPFMHAQFKNKNNKQVFAKVFPLVSTVTFFLVCLISLYSQEMVKILTRKEFYTSYKYVGGLALFYSLYIIKEVVDIGPKIKEKTKFLSYTFFLSVILNIFLLFFLIPQFKIGGVVFSMILTNLFLVSFSWFLSNKLYYIAFDLFKFLIVLLPALVLAIMNMFVDWSLLLRTLVALSCFIYYSLLIKRFYKNYKMIFQLSGLEEI